jgi:hypothetical protein
MQKCNQSFCSWNSFLLNQPKQGIGINMYRTYMVYKSKDFIIFAYNFFRSVFFSFRKEFKISALFGILWFSTDLAIVAQQTYP